MSEWMKSTNAPTPFLLASFSTSFNCPRKVKSTEQLVQSKLTPERTVKKSFYPLVSIVETAIKTRNTGTRITKDEN